MTNHSRLRRVLFATRNRARIPMIAAASALAAACFRYNPASRPDGEVLDTNQRDTSVIDDRLADTATPEDIAAIDSSDADASSPDVAVDSLATDSHSEDGPSIPPDVRADASDAGGPDACLPRDGGADAGIAAGSCAINNGGCSSFARCQQFCDGARQCICGNGLTLGSDGTSCSGLVLVSKTSITMPGTNNETSSFDLSISRTGRHVAFASVVETTLRTQRCFAADTTANTITEIGATRDAMDREQRAEACFAPLVTEDGTRALFVTRGLHPGDTEAPPMWPASILTTTSWPYYRDNGASPRRVNTWQNVLPTQIHFEGFNLFRFARDGRRMAFSTRSQVDMMLRPGDSMEFYSASIPILPIEPLFENVNTDRTIPPFFSGPLNSRDMDLAGDSQTLVLGSGRRINGELNPGTDIFLRRIGSTSTSNPTINMTPVTSGNSRWPTGSLDGSVVCFVSDSRGVGVTSGTEYVLSVRTGGGAPVFHRLGIPVPPSGALANSVSDDGTLLAVVTNAAYSIVDQPADTNNAMDYYLFDISTPASPRAIRRVNITRSNAEPMIAHTGGAQVRIAGDGNSVAFVTTQQLVPEDNNGGGPDVYLRVLR